MKKYIIALLLVAAVSGSAQAQISSIERISAISSAGGDGPSDNASISGNGSVIAFRSDSTNLVFGDANNKSDVFMWVTGDGGTLSLISKTNPGQQVNADSGKPGAALRGVMISDSGNYICFSTDATGWGTGQSDTNGTTDVLSSFQSTVLYRSSQSMTSPAGNGASTGCTIGDLGYTYFSSLADDLTSGDNNGTSDIYVMDGFAGLISKSTSDESGNGPSLNPVTDSQSRYVVFSSTASNLVGSDTNNASDVFLESEGGGTISILSEKADHTPGNGHSNEPFISASGDYAVFASLATNLGGKQSKNFPDIFFKDLTTGDIEIVSIGVNGGEANGASSRPSVSSDGRFVAFISAASNLVPDDTNGVSDLFVRDRQTSKTLRLNLSASGAQGRRSVIDAQIASEGKYAVFSTVDGSLVSGDTNGASDVFRVKLGQVLTPSTGIEEAPDLTAGEPGTHTLTVDMINFGKVSLVSNTARAVGRLNLEPARRGSTHTTSVNYVTTARGQGDIANDVRRRVTKRNRVTFRNLKNGSYNVSYKAVARRGKRKLFETAESPSASATIE
ncbi:MAG: hypothetical protein K1X83_07585 [Oligoflexia bacterium]|nr:hypothetical protein [Oligoflexia bacterium]